MEIVRDEDRWFVARSLALDAFVQHGGPEAPPELKKLLADVHAGVVSDADQDLLGTLLDALYPKSLSPSEILRHLKPSQPSSYSYLGHYYWFWRYQLPERSTNAQLAELLDGLADRFDELRPVLVGTERRQAPLAPLEPLGPGPTAALPPDPFSWRHRRRRLFRNACSTASESYRILNWAHCRKMWSRSGLG